jgi:transcriptional regulator with XRE-family HTH domain
MSQKRDTLTGQVRKAILQSGLTRYAIFKASGVDQAVLSRFMAGKVGLTLETLDALADVLRLEIVQRGKPVPIPKGRPGRKPKKGAKQ